MDEVERGRGGVEVWRNLLTNPNISGRAWTVEIQDVLAYISHLERIEAAASMFMRYYWTASTEDNGRERQELTEALKQALGGKK